MRGVLILFLVIGVATAMLCGGALVYWDLASISRDETWRMQTGSCGCLTLWLAFMILYIDRLWQQRSQAGSDPGNRLAGDSLMGWVLVGVSLLLGWTGVGYYFDHPPVGETRSIPLGVIRIGMSGLILAFGVCVLREGARRRRVEDTAQWRPVRPSGSLASATPSRATNNSAVGG